MPFAAGADATYGDDVARLRRHVDVIELTDAAGRARVALVAAYQGRVMTSTARGPEGFSFGWVNHALIAAGKTQPHINVFGGEDRFWLGPEGGPYSLFFAQSAPAQTLAHWQTLPTDPGATFDREEVLECGALAPQMVR